MRSKTPESQGELLLRLEPNFKASASHLAGATVFGSSEVDTVILYT